MPRERRNVLPSEHGDARVEIETLEHAIIVALILVADLLLPQFHLRVRDFGYASINSATKWKLIF